MSRHALLTISWRAVRVASLPGGGETLDIDEARRLRKKIEESRPDDYTPRLAALREIEPAKIGHVAPTPDRVEHVELLKHLGLIADEDARRASFDGCVSDAAWRALCALEEAVFGGTSAAELLADEGQRRAVFRSRCIVRPAESGDEVVYPDGTIEAVEARGGDPAILDCFHDLSAEDAVRAIAQHGMAPAKHKPGTSSPTTVVNRKCWIAELTTTGEPVPISWNPLEHCGALPWAAVLGVLDDLATSGWELSHVSEDRGINDSADTSFVTEVRYLLVRS